MNQNLCNLKRCSSFKSKLAVFDFDHTIIDVNSDTYFDKLVTSHPNYARASDKYKYPDEIESLTEKYCWTRRMAAVFEHMRSKYDIRRQTLIDCIREIQVAESMRELLRLLSANQFELIIVSDSNTVLIETILEANHLLDLFDKKNIFTNRAYFDSNECLRVHPLNEDFNADGEPFDCFTGICAKNICKGKILSDLLLKRMSNRESDESSSTESSVDTTRVDLSRPNQIMYFGDGTNDYCPSLVLNKSDTVFIRNDHSYARLLKKNTSFKDNILANITYWTSAADILGYFTKNS